MKQVLRFFLSLRTAIWLLISLILFFLIGAVMMPARPEYRALYMEPLLPWMLNSPPLVSWWLWLSLAASALLAANTLLCSIESIVRKREARQWLLIISPQIVHIGFLLILLAHLFSSYGSFKATAVAYQGTVLALPDGSEVLFRDVRAAADPSGFVTDWSADISYAVQGQETSRDTIRPNRPSLRNGMGLYIQTVRIGPFPVAIVELSKEPGAGWALAGGLFFFVGMVMLLIVKIRGEERSSQRTLPDSEA